MRHTCVIINTYQGFQQPNDAVYYSVIDSPLQQSAETASGTEIRTDRNEAYVTSERDRQRGNTQQPNDVTYEEVPDLHDTMIPVSRYL